MRTKRPRWVGLGNVPKLLRGYEVRDFSYTLLGRTGEFPIDRQGR
jgi:hypothetical protein